MRRRSCRCRRASTASSRPLPARRGAEALSVHDGERRAARDRAARAGALALALLVQRRRRAGAIARRRADLPGAAAARPREPRRGPPERGAAAAAGAGDRRARPGGDRPLQPLLDPLAVPDQPRGRGACAADPPGAAPRLRRLRPRGRVGAPAGAVPVVDGRADQRPIALRRRPGLAHQRRRGFPPCSFCWPHVRFFAFTA